MQKNYALEGYGTTQYVPYVCTNDLRERTDMTSQLMCYDYWPRTACAVNKEVEFDVNHHIGTADKVFMRHVNNPDHGPKPRLIAL